MWKNDQYSMQSGTLRTLSCTIMEVFFFFFLVAGVNPEDIIIRLQQGDQTPERVRPAPCWMEVLWCMTWEGAAKYLSKLDFYANLPQQYEYESCCYYCSPYNPTVKKKEGRKRKVFGVDREITTSTGFMWTWTQDSITENMRKPLHTEYANLHLEDSR